jgi:hypothetical protein
MSTFLAHPTIFSAYAAAAEADADLREGTHLRLFPSGRIGFPLAPFVLCEIPALTLRAPPFAWFSRDGQPLPGPDLDQAGGEVFGWLTAPPPSPARLIGIEAYFHSGSGEIAILGIENRVIAARSSPRFLVAAPMITRLRLRGRGPVTLLGWVVTPDAILERIIGGRPFATLGLPIDGDGPWYAGGEGRDVAWQRVGSGAPRRWTRPDRPDGPFDPLAEAAEEARVAAFQRELDRHVVGLLQDPATPPAKTIEVHDSPAGIVSGIRQPWQRATVEIQNALLMKALDTGAGRYLGLMTRLEHLPPDQYGQGAPSATAWLAAGVFACNVRDRRRLPMPDALENRLLERLIDLFPELARIVAHARRGLDGGVWIDIVDGERRPYRLEIRALVAPALAAPPPDLLAAPTVRLGPAQWQRERQGPSFRFRQQFLIAQPPLAALAALGRLESGDWVTRHQMLALAPGANPSERAATRMLGRRESLVDGRSGLVDDTDIAAAGAPWTYRVALSDVFGRFGAAAELAVPMPPRPAIPAPALQAQLHLAARAAHRGPAQAGTVTFRVPAPAVEELTAGSNALAQLAVSFDGLAKSVAVPQAGGELVVDFDLPALALMETRRLEARARFDDVEGNAGPDAVLAIDIADPRAPDIPKAGLGIIWSSRPGPSEDVEFRIGFKGIAGARYRAYLSDARGLGIPATAPFPGGERPRTRAEIAVDGANRGLVGLGLRERFRLITDPPLEPRPDGTVLLDTRLPRTLDTVQFLRFVPLSARGAEADFSACPLVPIAVPSDRRPPAPRIEARVDPATGGARLTIVAEGLDRVALEAAEPGLFGGVPPAAAQPPAFRLRRASGVVPEVIYAREVNRGTLAMNGETFNAEVADMPAADGLIPFVRYFYWAEVRMPPERRIPADVAEIALPAGSILPTETRQRENAPGAFSLPSPPAPVMRVPPNPPALDPGSITATVRAGTPGATYVLEIRIVGAPVAHPRAIGAYRLRVHIREGGGDLVTEPTQPTLAGDPFVWSTQRPAAVVPQVRVMLIPIDPLGREGPAVSLDAVAA